MRVHIVIKQEGGERDYIENIEKVFYAGWDADQYAEAMSKKDGCEESYFYDCTLTELEKQPKATKKFIKYGERASV